MIRRYESLKAFYAGDERRARSVEVEFGAAWRTDDSAKGAWRAVWVEDTGELVIVKQRWVEGRCESGVVHVLATGLGELEDVQELLAGWPDRCGRLFSLQWLRDRCAAAGAVPQGA